MNRLAQESSPYLRQHADNPVDWHPWDDVAFAEARRRDVPVLLSVGYSACHWCHVMAHESFEDPDTAAVLNELFVNVKVDREERPDIDALYMDAVQAMNGHGGWPMTVFLAPDGRPFFGGTYFPNQARGNMPSLLDICRAVDDAWRTRRDDLLEHADTIADELTRTASLGADDSGSLTPEDLLAQALESMRAQFDAEWGGFGRAPKFPQAMSLDLILRLRVGGQASDDDLAMVMTSLDAMASGGLYDHLGGGFARYATDAFWMVPHFEKMLYDQALLARVYLHAWQLTLEPRYLQVLEETVDYVLRDLRSPGGALCSAEDADSEGEEGRFYVWRPEEIVATVADDDSAQAAIAWYGVSRSGNFEGSNILHRPVRGDLLRPTKVETARRALLAARNLRVRPGLDDKVLTEWNALFVATLAEAAGATQNDEWRRAAVEVGDFLRAELRREDGRWLRAWHPTSGARHLAVAADYAALVDAFTRLAEATGESRWLDEAVGVAEALVALFWDDDRGGLFTTGHDAEVLVARQKDLVDNATPSANSTAALALARLGALTGDQRWTDTAYTLVALVLAPAATHPTAFAHLLAAVDFLAGPTTEIVVVGPRPDLVTVAQVAWLPNAVLAWGTPYPSPLWAGRSPGAAYVCQGYTCELPATTVADLETQLGIGVT